MVAFAVLGALAALRGASAAVSIPTKEIAPGVHMPVMSIGTGGLSYEHPHQAADIVTAWMRAGGRGVDTAYVYKDQAAVAGAIAGAGVDRHDVFITTKIPGCHDARMYVEADLEQLGTDYIDLLLIHFPVGGDCSATWEVLEEYHARGILRSIGVSNFKVEDLTDLLKTATVVPAVNQIYLNLLNHTDDLLNLCAEHGITVEAYSPLYRHGSADEEIQEVAAAHGISVFQVALKWILQHGWVFTFQSTSQAHQESDADLFSFTLTDAEMYLLDSLQGKAASTPLAASLGAVVAAPHLRRRFLGLVATAALVAVTWAVAACRSWRRADPDSDFRLLQSE